MSSTRSGHARNEGPGGCVPWEDSVDQQIVIAELRDEIDRLRAEVRQSDEIRHTAAAECALEIERLRAELAAAKRLKR